MVLISRTKSGKGKCPVCEKYVELYHDYDLNVMVLECCDKKWSLFPKKIEVKKPKRTIKPKKSNVDLLKNLKDYHYGKKDE